MIKKCKRFKFYKMNVRTYIIYIGWILTTFYNQTNNLGHTDKKRAYTNISITKSPIYN